MPLPFAPQGGSAVGRLSARYVDDKIVLSDTHAWTYVRIPAVTYDFLEPAERINAALRFNLAMTALVTGFEPVDCHLVVTHHPFQVDRWLDGLTHRVNRWHPNPGWGGYITDLADHVADSVYLQREIYLGVCLGRRGDTISGGLQDLFRPMRKIADTLTKTAGYEDHAIPTEEIKKWRAKATETRRSLVDSHLRAMPISANQAAWLISKPLWPAMECPSPTNAPASRWGLGEVAMLAEGYVENGRRMLRVEQNAPDGSLWEGYSATLCAARFPDVLSFPAQEPWLMYASALEFPVDINLRFSLVPPRKVHQDIKKKLADAKDQAAHIQEAGISVPLQVQEALESATLLEWKVDKERQSWVYGRYRFTVTGLTEEETAARARRLIEHYRDLGIDLVWPTGDQFDMLCEAMPGDRVRATAYEQRQESLMIAGGMPHADVWVGDRIAPDGKGWLGPYLGYTTSRTVNPVFLSPHVAIARNNAPGIAITGTPGAGKSFSAFTLAHQMALQGVWTIYIDPKADAIPLAGLPGLGKPRLFDLRNGNDGMLDPFSLDDDLATSKLRALETVRLLLGGSMGEQREEALTQAIEQVVMHPNPSLSKVVDTLIQHPEAHGRNLGGVLNTIRDLPFARLCFAPSGGSSINPEDGLTIITLLGLSLPAAGKPLGEYGYEERLAVSVMYLLTRYARRLMLNMDKSHPKAICIDEAWAITATPQGKQMIPEVARMGRSHNTALLLVTQNATDLRAEGVTNSITTRMAFRANDTQEIDDVLAFLGVAVHDGNRELVRNLGNGECLIRDVDGRVTRVQIEAWNPRLFEAFNTNPETRGVSTHDETYSDPAVSQGGF